MNKVGRGNQDLHMLLEPLKQNSKTIQMYFNYVCIILSIVTISNICICIYVNVYLHTYIVYIVDTYRKFSFLNYEGIDLI